MDDIFGTPRSRSASATSQSSSNPGCRWDQLRRPSSNIDLSDLGPFTDFPIYSPDYEPSFKMLARTSELANDYLGLQVSASSCPASAFFDANQTYNSMSLSLSSSSTFRDATSEKFFGAAEGCSSVDYESGQSSIGSNDSYASPVYAVDTQPIYESLCSTDTTWDTSVPDYTLPESYLEQALVFPEAIDGSHHSGKIHQRISSVSGHGPVVSLSISTPMAHTIATQRPRGRSQPYD
ncbi:hypothetical protein MMC13_007778 [Lambiella insularis]|nr:hypothetical protein [Lambiella insularis]